MLKFRIRCSPVKGAEPSIISLRFLSLVPSRTPLEPVHSAKDIRLRLTGHAMAELIRTSPAKAHHECRQPANLTVRLVVPISGSATQDDRTRGFTRHERSRADACPRSSYPEGRHQLPRRSGSLSASQAAPVTSRALGRAEEFGRDQLPVVPFTAHGSPRDRLAVAARLNISTQSFTIAISGSISTDRIVERDGSPSANGSRADAAGRRRSSLSKNHCCAVRLHRGHEEPFVAEIFEL